MPPTSRSTKAKPSSPVGVSFGGRNNDSFRIGERIGSGACASVHLVEGAPDFVVKVAPLPTKTTRKRDSPVETNARILSYETTMYRVQFQPLQGTTIPRLPHNSEMTVPCGDVDGFRFVVMERMEKPLLDAVKMMKKQSQSQTSIHFGALAVRMLECVRAIHDEKHVVVDIKTENFMLAFASSKRKKTDFMTDLVSRVRILDLALVLPYRQIASHRPDDGSGAENGTPLYRSLFMHQGSTPSRRDDLEALAYVIAELLIEYHRGEGQSSKFILPWSKGQSDVEIGKIKEEQVNDKKSELYQSIGDQSVAKAFSSYLDEVRNYSFKQVPDYESLSESLSQINLSSAKSKSSTKKPAAARPAPASRRTTKRTGTTTDSNKRRVTRSQVATRDEVVDLVDSEDEDEECAPSPTKTRRSDESFDTAQYDNLEEAQEADVSMFSDTQQTYYTNALENHSTAHDDAKNKECPVPMDFEIIGDENDEPELAEFEDAVDDMPMEEGGTAVAAKSNKPLVGMRLKYESGPKAMDIDLMKGRNEKISVGSKPSASKVYELVTLKGDADITPNHIKLDLVASKKLTVVTVTRHKSGGEVRVRNHDLDPGANTRAFSGDVITIGSTKFKVVKLG